MMLLDEGGVLCKEGYVDREAFIAYRRSHELEYPLTPELERLNLGYLPQPLRLWARLKDLSGEALRARRKVASAMTEERLHVDDVAFVLHNAGIQFTREEVSNRYHKVDN